MVDFSSSESLNAESFFWIGKVNKRYCYFCSERGGIISSLLHVLSSLGDGFNETQDLVSTASFHDLTPGILQPAVGDEDRINEGPDTESTESDGLDDSPGDVSEVESVDTGETGSGES